MRILILYYQEYERGVRQTIHEHLYSFKRYSQEDCYYLNVFSGIPWFLEKISFDLVVYHYTICACKWELWHFSRFQKKWKKLKRLQGYKVAIPQDDYIHSDAMNAFFRDFGIKTVFTAASEKEWQVIYPREASGLEHYVTVFTGYIDETALKNMACFRLENREIDIGYRARKLPFWIGQHGQLKTMIGEQFLKKSTNSRLKMDISLDPEDVFFGNEWYRFLCRCRTVLGCEGGASLLDATGEIRLRVEEYVSHHPEASFEEVERTCFPGLDNNLNLFVITPRHFECAITKTCQVLLEGDYAGILKPGIHYIEVKKDWSNLEEVFRRIEDVAYCRKIAENTYRDIVESGLYTYRQFVKKVFDHCRAVGAGATPGKDSQLERLFLYLLAAREIFKSFFWFKSFLQIRFKQLVKWILKRIGLLPYYYRRQKY